MISQAQVEVHSNRSNPAQVQSDDGKNNEASFVKSGPKNLNKYASPVQVEPQIESKNTKQACNDTQPTRPHHPRSAPLDPSPGQWVTMLSKPLKDSGPKYSFTKNSSVFAITWSSFKFNVDWLN